MTAEASFAEYESQKSKWTTIYRIGYLRFGKWFEPWIEKGKFQKLNKTLKMAGYEVSLRGYLGMTLFFFIAIFLGLVATTTVVGLLLLLLGIMQIMDALVLILMLLPIDLVIAGFIALLHYYWPTFKIGERRIMIESSLPTVSSYMSAMASAGVPPAPIFSSMAREDIAPEITKEAKRINRDTEILGLDILQSLSAAAYRSPSEKFSSFLEGINATVTSGGDLVFYLATETKMMMKLKEEEGKEFIEGLGVIAEIFMVIGVVAPLFFIVMVAIMSVIGMSASTPIVLNGVPLSFSALILILLSYMIMPIIMIGMILLISTIERAE